MDTNLDDLIPAVSAKAKAALAAAAAHGVACIVTYTLRTLAEQKALYAQGRQPLAVVNCLRHDAGLPAIGEGDNNIVTNCDGVRIADGGKGRSPHQLGIALDVVPAEGGAPVWPAPGDKRWEDIAYFFEAEGFEWGGRWADFPDYPHYQMAGA